MRCSVPLPISNPKALLLSLLLALPSLAGTEIILKGEAPFRPSLRLADVATIKGGKERILRFLRNLKIGGEILRDRQVTAEEIRGLLAENLIDLDHIHISGSKVVLYSKKAKLTREDLERLIREYISSHYSGIEVRSLSLRSREIPIPGGRYRVEIGERSRTFAHLYLQVKIYGKGELIESLPVTANVVQYIRVPYALRPIKKGSLIGEKDIVWKEVRRRNSRQRALKPEEILSHRARRDIGEGREIRPSMVEPDYLVKKRRSVKILYERGAIRIELLGLALQNGEKGDIIRVKNLSSNKVLRCKVISSGLVSYLP
ncbi:MAG: flagellar basal body P-ring formation protein FlgA [Epsilonproteobacteria bacterium]|nr:flagella basal body P-ring formation protein FlgA [Campylobacterota bacterium]NPA57383.1 flagellar basal body P-ring formation protein FlgA [Campylobacterota bacterium]